MTTKLATGWLVAAVLICGLASAGNSPGAENPPANRPSETEEADQAVQVIQLRGRVVCLPEEMQRGYKAELPTRHQHVWGFKSNQGAFYTLLRARFSEAIWLDERIRSKELLVTARLFPKTQVLELQRIKSLRDGVVHDLYYYCDVCAIKSVSPEPCACCQGPVKLVEQPLAGKGAE